MMTRVLIAGYLLVFATLRDKLQLVVLLGTTSRPRTIEHTPASFHVFLPGETLARRRDKSVDDFFATTVFFTVKPGRAESDKDVSATCPVEVLVVILNLYFTPLVNPSTTHEVLIVRHTTSPVAALIRYVTWADVVTAVHDKEIDPLRETLLIDTGTLGFPSGIPIVVTASDVPDEFTPITEIEYSVPFTRPVIAHVVVDDEHVKPLGVAVAV